MSNFCSSSQPNRSALLLLRLSKVPGAVGALRSSSLWTPVPGWSLTLTVEVDCSNRHDDEYLLSGHAAVAAGTARRARPALGRRRRRQHHHHRHPNPGILSRRAPRRSVSSRQPTNHNRNHNHNHNPNHNHNHNHNPCNHNHTPCNHNHHPCNHSLCNRNLCNRSPCNRSPCSPMLCSHRRHHLCPKHLPPHCHQH